MLSMRRMSSPKLVVQLTCCCLLMIAICATLVSCYRPNHFVGQPSRRLDCSAFCRKTGFSGYAGGCKCGFTLFANKRTQLSPLVSKLFQADHLKLYDTDGALDVGKVPINEKTNIDSPLVPNREIEENEN